MDTYNARSGTAFLARCLPRGWQGYLLILGSLIFHSAYYLWLMQGDEFIMSAGLGLFFILIPILGIVGPLVLSLVGGIVWYTIRTRGNLLPLVIFGVGWWIVPAIPQPLPRPS